MVRAMIVPGHGFMTWGYVGLEGDIRPATFSGEDQIRPIFPAFFPHSERDPALYYFVQNLSSHLYSSVLGAEDVAANYGEANASPPVNIPKGDDWVLQPDEETLRHFREYCGHEH